MVDLKHPSAEVSLSNLLLSAVDLLRRRKRGKKKVSHSAETLSLMMYEVMDRNVVSVILVIDPLMVLFDQRALGAMEPRDLNLELRARRQSSQTLFSTAGLLCISVADRPSGTASNAEPQTDFKLDCTSCRPRHGCRRVLLCDQITAIHTPAD